uniref:Uncharacterized protein n=1 Tax=Graphocephala atropunctata TaxID=36148 RepID=A0A1B6KLY5_9HEMI
MEVSTQENSKNQPLDLTKRVPYRVPWRPYETENTEPSFSEEQRLIYTYLEVYLEWAIRLRVLTSGDLDYIFGDEEFDEETIIQRLLEDHEQALISGPSFDAVLRENSQPEPSSSSSSSVNTEDTDKETLPISENVTNAGNSKQAVNYLHRYHTTRSEES